MDFNLWALVACGSNSSWLLHASDRRHGAIEDGPKVGISPSTTLPNPVIAVGHFSTYRSALIMLTRVRSPLVCWQEQVQGVREETPADPAEKMGAF